MPEFIVPASTTTQVARSPAMSVPVKAVQRLVSIGSTPATAFWWSTSTVSVSRANDRATTVPKLTLTNLLGFQVLERTSDPRCVQRPSQSMICAAHPFIPSCRSPKRAFYSRSEGWPRRRQCPQADDAERRAIAAGVLPAHRRGFEEKHLQG